MFAFLPKKNTIVEFKRHLISSPNDIISLMLPRKAAGHSIPASEHSTITSWGVNGEVDAMTNMLLSYPTGLVACVSQRKKHTRTKPSYFELQVVCFCFQCFPFASPDNYFQVSDSFDVFKACKDGENSKKCQIFWS